MGKRGPKPRGEYAGKSKVLSTRIRPDLRAALDAASKKSGRSLSQEIEYRLRRTFTDEKEIRDRFGSRENFYIMRAIDLAIQTVVMREESVAEWLNDPETFDRVCKTIGVVLDAIRPPDLTPEELEYSAGLDADMHSDPETLAALVWKSIQDADPARQLDKGSNLDHRLALLKSELGAIAKRPKLTYDVGGNLRWKGEQFDQEKEIVFIFRQFLFACEDLPEEKSRIDEYIRRYPRAWDLANEVGPLPPEPKESPAKRSRRKK